MTASRRAAGLRRRPEPAPASLLAAVILTIALVAGATGCGTSAPTAGPAGTLGPGSTEPDDGAPVDGGSLAVGLVAETNGWNPYQGQWSASSFFVANAIYDPLVALAPDGSVAPYLADRITPDPDFLRWTIGLRPGVTFHDGTKLDSAAVKANLDVGRRSGLTALAMATISGVEAADELTVVVTMSKPWSTFPYALIGQAGYVAAPATLESSDGGRQPVGTGPFRFVSWTPGDTLEVTRNPAYWRAGLPRLDEIDFHVINDATSRLAALRSGSIDVLQATTPDLLLELQSIADDGDIRLATDVGEQTDESIIALNTAVAPFDDPLAREIIATGLDQRGLAETAYSGAFPPAWGAFADDDPAFLAPPDAGYPDFDAERAEELVARYEEAHGGPLSFTTLVPSDPAYLSIAQALQAQALDAGIDVQLEVMEQATLITTVLSGNYQASGFVLTGSPHFDRAYPFLATTPAPVGSLSLNFTRLANPRITEAMDAARATADPLAQAEQYAIVQQEMATDLDKIFLVHNVSGIASDSRVRGVDATTIPGTDQTARSGTLRSSPFLTSAWLRS